MSIKFNTDHLKGFVDEKDIKSLEPKIQQAHQQLEKRDGPGHEFLGWMDLPGRIQDSLINELNQLAKEVQSHSDAMI